MLRWSSFGQQVLKWREYDRHSSFILLRHDSLGHWDTLTFPTTWWWWSRRRGRLWPRGDRFSSFFEYIPVTDLCVLMMEYVIGSKSGVGAVYGRSKRSWRFSHRHKWVPIITGSVGSDRTCVCVCVCVVVSCREININTLSPRQAAMSLSLQGNREVFGDLLCWRISRELFHQVTYKQTKISLVLLLSTEHVNELNSHVPDWVLGPLEGFSNNPGRTTS